MVLTLDSIDINALRSIEDIRRAYDALTRDEERVGSELDAILEQQASAGGGGLDVRLRGVVALTPHLTDIRADADQLSSLIAHTATLAEKVSAKVRQLDLAKSRVAECQQRVHDLIDLKRCSEGVTTALQEENYEEAAAHIHRFLGMDEAVLRSTGQDLETGSGRKNTSLDSSLATLHQAENKVRGIVTRRFDEAVNDEDLASIERFFKIFPLINMHEEGLRRFTQYLRGKLSAASKENLKQALDTPPGDKRAAVIFADTLTLLFEGVARIVEIHQPLIETYYGPGRILTVLSLLQEECDIQAMKIFKEFNRRRGISDKVRRVEESSGSGSSSSSQAARRGEETAKLQARDLDSLLGEMTLVQARVEMYWRFVRKRCLADMEVAQVGGQTHQERRTLLDTRLAASQLNRAAEDSLGEYILLERYFMAENIAKAVELDSMEADQLTTSMLDDVFFIIKKCVKRAIGSSSPDGICAVINNACTLLESDFYRVFQNQIKLGFPSTYLDQAYTVIQSSLQQGKLGGTSDTERQKQLFLAYLNNAESGAQYIGKLQTSIEGDLSYLMSSSTLSAKQAAKITSCLAGLPAVTEQLRTVLEAGMAALRTAAVRPRLKPWIDGFLAVSHNIGEEQLADYAANDPFVQALIVNIDGLVTAFHGGLTAANHESFVMLVAGEATLQLEKAVMKSSFNRLGGLQFDKEVRALCSYLTSLTAWTIRDKFARLIQVANLLNLETLQEVNEFCSNQGSGSLKLSASEVRQVLQLRADFKPEEIKRVKFSLTSSASPSA